jgi:hypothetical protein
MESVALHMRRDAISVFETNFCPAARSAFSAKQCGRTGTVANTGRQVQRGIRPQNITEYGKIQNIALDVNNFPLICTVSLTSFMVFL